MTLASLSAWKEKLLQKSGGMAADTLVSLARWQKGEQAVARVGINF